MAARLWRGAAEKGDAAAQEDLGDCYYLGKGVAAVDAGAAALWFRRAAEQVCTWTFLDEGFSIGVDFGTG